MADSGGRPEQIYRRRRDRQRGLVGRLSRLETRLSIARLLAFAAILLMAWLPLAVERFSALWLGLPAAVFLGLVVRHAGVIRDRTRAERAAGFYEQGLARIDGDWQGRGASGERFAVDGHPYAVDLDLFGEGSLFELYCVARSSAGRGTLARWLMDHADAATIRARQRAVAELTDDLDFREELVVIAGEVDEQLHPDRLVEWSQRPRWLSSGPLRWLAIVCPVLSIATLVGWPLAAWGPLPFVAALALQSIVAARLRDRVTRVLNAVETPGRELELLASVMRRIERRSFRSELLVALRGRLDTDGVPPSRAIDSLRRRVDLMRSRYNQLFAPVAALTLWGTHFAYAIEAWRLRHGPHVAEWLDAMGQIEALACLAGRAFEQPDDVFPEIVDGPPLFDAGELGHPLLPDPSCVRNDVRLSNALRLLVVSGSNMAGKSTLLRAVGVAAVVAQAGGKVRARSLRMTPLAVGATIRVDDSLQRGRSRFYAEILRIKQVMDLAAGSPPLLFLLDEILHGTNSHERRIGAAAVLKQLVGRGALGLVTTHDLALVEIVAELDGVAENVHLEDRYEDGEMTFDYKLKPGVVRRGSALALMRGIGLEV